jgi:hypothetical protein
MTSPLPVANRILCLLARKDRSFAELVATVTEGRTQEQGA